jgi:hypothetical protein
MSAYEGQTSVSSATVSPSRPRSRDRSVALDAHPNSSGCAKVYREKASGAKTDRAQLRRVIDQLEKSEGVDVDAP